MGRLQDRIAVVSGGGNGIGRAICERFAEEGATVTVADLDGGAAAAVAAGLGGASRGVGLDVRDEAGWNALIDEVLARHGRLDVLVNNAGILSTTRRQTIEEVELEEWRAVQSVNVEGVFLGCRAGVRAMRDRGGAIVNMSSVAALVATPPTAAYGASKGAIRQLTKSVAVHCARKGYRIRCNSVHPGLIDTDMGRLSMFQVEGDPEENFRRRVGLTPLGEAGTPLDIANGVLFLASDEARHITGAELVIDGGMTAV